MHDISKVSDVKTRSEGACSSSGSKETDEDPVLYEIRNAGRIFGGLDGVQIEELDIPAGKMIAILGESGSGKSTLLNLLGNLVKGHAIDPTKEATLKYQTVKRSRFRKRRMKVRSQELVPTNVFVRFWNGLREYFPWPSSSLIRKEAGYVFQEAYLLKNVTVSANLALPLRLRGMWSWIVNKKHIEHIARHLDKDTMTGVVTDKDKDDAAIFSKLGKRSWQLSGGQAQRVAVGRAVVRNPSIILADEPTASLDPDLGVRIIAMLRKWQKGGSLDAPRTVIWATHTMEHAASFADKIIILRKGKLIEIPDFQDFKEKYGSTWPIDNPRDHELIQGLLDDTAGGLDVDLEKRSGEVIEHIVDTHLWRDQQIVDEAPDLSPPPHSSNIGGLFAGNFSIGVLWRLALSEIFSHVNIDKGAGPTLLSKLVSITNINQPASGREIYPFWKDMLSAFFLVLSGFFLVLSGYVSLNGGMSLLGPGAAELVRGAAAVGGEANDLLAGICTSCRGSLPVFENSVPWLGKAAIVLGALLLVYVVLRSYWRSVGGKLEFLTYFLILVFLAGAIKGSDVIDDVFRAQFKSPELGNTVIEARSLNRKLSQSKLDQLDTTLKAVGFTPPAKTVTGDEKIGPAGFAYGRYEKVDVVIGRLPKGWAPIKPQKKLVWGGSLSAKKTKDTKAKECSTGSNEQGAELLAINMSEPMVATLPFLNPRHLAISDKASYERLEQKNSNSVWGVYLTLKILRKMGFKPGQDGDQVDQYFCLDLYGEKIVRLAGVIDRLPSDSSSDYQILVDKTFFRDRYHKKKSRYPANFHKATLYVDTERPADFIRTVECASMANRVALAGCSGELITNIKSTLEYAFRVEGGFDAIKQAISMGDLFKRISVVILAAFLFLAALLTLKISTSYILQNERSLCVMRAFGASVWQVLYLILIQFTLILLPGLLMGGVLAFYFWPAVGESLATLLGVDSSVVLFNSFDAITILSVVSGALLSGCLVAVFGWWRGSRWVAERLKQVG